MSFDDWMEEVRTQSERRLGLDFETEFGRDRATAMFADRLTPTEAIDWLLRKYGLDDLDELNDPRCGGSVVV